MSDPINPSDIPQLSSEQLKQKAEEVLNGAPPEVQQAVKKSQSFYEENKPVIGTLVLGFIVYKLSKRIVYKTSLRAFQDAMDSGMLNVTVDQPIIDIKELAPEIVKAFTAIR